MPRHTVIRRALLLVACACLPIAAHAQVAAPLAVRAQHNPGAVGTSPQPGVTRSRYEVPRRLLLGVGGSLAGALGGALFGGNVVYQGDCACEDPGLTEAVMGAAIGSVVSSAIFAAIPEFGSRCGLFKRMGMGVAGSALGALAGGVVGAAAGGPGVPIGYVGGAGIGAGLMSAACR